MSSDTTPAPTAKPMSGFAALEAKVEEIQAQTTIEAERPAEDSALPTSDEEPASLSAEATLINPPIGLLTSGSGLPHDNGSLDASAASGLGVFTALQETAFDVVRLQGETLARFARVRGPRDLLSAQLAYGRRVLELQVSIWSRVLNAAPRLQPPMR